MRQKVYSNTPWEKSVAYSRATRVGPFIFVSGTTAVDEHGRLVGHGSMYAQADYAFAKIARALEGLGASMKNVVRTRAFVTSMAGFDEFARAHRMYFEGIDPAATCVQVGAFVSPDMLIEIEADALVDA